MECRAFRRSGTYRSAAAELLAEMRTEPDVTSGVLTDSRDGRARAVEYRPRRGTRYSLVLTDLGGMPGAPDGVLVWVAGLGSMVLPSGGGPVRHGRVQDSLRCSVTDAVVIAELLGHLTGRGATSAEEFAFSRCA